MPNVPTDLIPQVTPGQRPDVRLNPNAPLDAFGGGPGVADAYGQARGLASDVGKIAYQEMQEKNRSDVDDAVVQLSQLQQKVLKDPNTGALAARGEAAIPASQQAMEDFKKGAQAIDSTLTDPEQKKMFRSKLTEYHVQTSGILSNHVFGQIQEKKATSLAASAEEFGNAAESMATTDLSAVRTNLQAQEQKIRELSQFNGLDATSTQVAVDKGLSGTNLRVLSMMTATGNDLVAKQYYDANKDAFKGTDAIHAADMVNRGSSIGEATRIVDSVFQKDEVHFFDRPNQTGPAYQTEKDALDAVREATKDSPPIVREKAEEMAYRRYHVEKLAEKDSQDKTFEATADELRKSGNLEAIQNSPAWETMGEQDRRRLEETASRIARGDTPYAKVSDPQVTAGFYGLNKDDVAKLSKADLMRLAPQVTEGKYNDMEKHWNAARQKEEDATFKTTHEDDRVIFDTLKRSGLVDLKNVPSLYDLKKEKNKGKADAYNPVWEEVINEYQRFFDENNKNPNQVQKKEILRDIIIDKTLHKPQTFMQKWGSVLLGSISGNPVAGVIGQEGLQSYLNPGLDISADDRARIAKEISTFGGEVSQEKVQMIRRAELMQASDAEIKKLARE